MAEISDERVRDHSVDEMERLMKLCDLIIIADEMFQAASDFDCAPSAKAASRLIDARKAFVATAERSA